MNNRQRASGRKRDRKRQKMTTTTTYRQIERSTHWGLRVNESERQRERVKWEEESKTGW